MKQLRMTVHFDAPIERVFQLGTDFKRYPEWNVSYTEVKEVTGPPDQVGTKVYAVMQILGRKMEGWGEIVEVDPPRLLRTAGSSTQGGTLTTTFRFTPAGSGTDVVLEADYDLPAGILGQIADKLFLEKAIERSVRHSLENFKALVETPQPVLA